MRVCVSCVRMCYHHQQTPSAYLPFTCTTHSHTLTHRHNHANIHKNTLHTHTHTLFERFPHFICGQICARTRTAREIPVTLTDDQITVLSRAACEHTMNVCMRPRLDQRTRIIGKANVRAANSTQPHIHEKRRPAQREAGPATAKRERFHSVRACAKATQTRTHKCTRTRS